MAWWRVFAFLALPVMAASILSGCVAPGDGAAVPVDSPELMALRPRPAGMISGREYVLGQVVAREHERTDVLQRQLEQRAEEVQRLRTEVGELRQRETDLRAALERAQAPAVSMAPRAASGIAPGDSDRAAGSDVADPEPSEAVAAAALQRQQREAEQEQQAAVTRLQTALTQEQQRRQEVETQLARLKEETSSPPYAPADASAAELATAKQQVAELRAALDDERAARERLAQDFRALQRRTATYTAATETASAENADLRSRLQQLQEEKQNLTQSFNRSFAESQQRAADLERELRDTRTAPAADDGGMQVASVRAENTALRSRLDEEHRRTEELAAKLKVAMRVTDLIFKMQAQQTQPRY